MLWTWTVVTEVMLLAVCAFALKMILDRWGPGRMRGVASRDEAERLLGVTRLRTVRRSARPLREAPAPVMKMIFKPTEVGWRLGRGP